MLVLQSSAQGTGGEISAVRGKLDRKTPQGPQPAVGVAITISSKSEKSRSYPAYTGANGMFYLNVPAGVHILEIWLSQDSRVPPLRYEIQVKEPYTDLPPIVLPDH